MQQLLCFCGSRRLSDSIVILYHQIKQNMSTGTRLLAPRCTNEECALRLAAFKMDNKTNLSRTMPFDSVLSSHASKVLSRERTPAVHPGLRCLSYCGKMILHQPYSIYHCLKSRSLRSAKLSTTLDTTMLLPSQVAPPQVQCH